MIQQHQLRLQSEISSQSPSYPIISLAHWVKNQDHFLKRDKYEMNFRAAFPLGANVETITLNQWGNFEISKSTGI
jgi:hypothetical protein